MDEQNQNNEIKELVNAGFSHEDAIQALKMSNYDDIKIEQYINRLENADKMLLLTICNKILNYPQKTKYTDINCSKLSKKCSETAINFLCMAGFKRSNDGNRLTLEQTNTETLLKAQSLLTSNWTNTIISAIITLMNESKSVVANKIYGISTDEAKDAFVMSTDLNSKQDLVSNMDMDDIVKCLNANGYDFQQSINTVVSSEYNLNQTLETLIYGPSDDRNTKLPRPSEPLQDKKFHSAVKWLIRTGDDQKQAEITARRHWNDYDTDMKAQDLIEDMVASGNDRERSIQFIQQKRVDVFVSLGYNREATKKALEITNFGHNEAQDILDGIFENEGMNEFCNNLTVMGFSKSESMKALGMTKFHMNDALTLLLDGSVEDVPSVNKENTENKQHKEDSFECIGNMEKCQPLICLQRVLTKYNSIQFECNLDDIDVLSILDNFHHLQQQHNSNEEFEEMCIMFGECDIFKCDKHRRNRRDRTKEPTSTEFDDSDRYHRLFIVDVIDTIHCLIYHSYDIGYRFTKSERIQIEQKQITKANVTEYEDILSISSNDETLITVQKIMSPKLKIHQQLVNDQFVNKFNAMTINNGNCETYTSGQRYVYWKYFEKDELTKNYCIYPKYQSLKEELTENPFCRIPIEQYKIAYKKAVAHKNSRIGKQMIANPETHHDFSNSLLKFEVFAYEIQKEQPIAIKHLLAVIVYCGFSLLSYEFSKTYRRMDCDDLKDDDYKRYLDEFCVVVTGTPWTHFIHSENTNNESNSSMKARHGKFYHLARNLNELIHVFSPRAMDAKPYITQFYHGINKKMKFISLRENMCQPFSTTSSMEVAINFGGVNGMVLELNSSGWSRYYDCQYISPYAAEKELLFINTIGPFKIINITDINLTKKYDYAIKALGVIDALSIGNPFQPNDEVAVNSRIQKNIIKRISPKLNGAKPIDPIIQLLTLRLIKHELHRYKPHKYSKMEHIDSYIEELLHYMCLTTKAVIIDWELMFIEIIERYEKGGYNGYLFCKTLFCKKNLPIIDLDFISLLFPNVTNIHMVGGGLSKDCLDYILEFLTKGSTKHIVEMNFECNFVPDLMSSEYYIKFRSIPWVLSCGKSDKDGKCSLWFTKCKENFKEKVT
eukprot:367629_1